MILEFVTNLAQGLSQKVGFFLILEPILLAGFLSSKNVRSSNKKSALVLVSGSFVFSQFPGFHLHPVTPLSLKLDESNFVQNYFGIRSIFCNKKNRDQINNDVTMTSSLL